MTTPLAPTTSTTRVRDWPERLDALITARQNWPFVWGTNDCCTFAADAVQALTGRDVMGHLRHQYATALDAHHLTRELGGLTAAVTALIGDPVDPIFATVGDVLLVDNRGREVLAICNGATAVAPGKTSLQTIADPHVLAAWRVA